MKGTFFISIIVLFTMLAIPLSALEISNEDSLPASNVQSNVLYTQNDIFKDGEKIKVLVGDTICEYSIKDYVFGVVAAEMPALYSEEALKAQAVAAYTFVCYKKQTSQTDEYDISANPETAQCFITRDEAKSRWGTNADEYEAKLNECIDAVQGEWMSYEGKPIFAAYHAISSGKTNSCADVWGNELPYLKSVESSGDSSATGFLSNVSFTTQELAEKMKSVVSASGEGQTWFSNFVRTDSGYVKSVDVCGEKITGSQIRALLNLRSTNFEVEFKDGAFAFSVKGYGHGVGMSQTGADYLAKQGKNYKEILLHYYTGIGFEKN